MSTIFWSQRYTWLPEHSQDAFLRLHAVERNDSSTWEYLKIDVSCEASVNFRPMSQNATPASEFMHVVTT